ncbi:MAG: response regulator [Pseudomonadota bacterium]
MVCCLIVEDSDLIREIAGRIVRELGLDVVEAENAPDGVDACEEHSPAVVLLDWDLPSMGALDFLRGAAGFAPEKRPTIVLCATENDPQQFTLAKAAGAAHHILKPYDRDSIKHKFTEIGLVSGNRVQSGDRAGEQFAS